MSETPRTDGAVDHYFYNKGASTETLIECARQLERELAELKEWKQEVLESQKAIMQEPCDANEKHCTCVPALRRELAKAHASIEYLSNALEKANTKIKDLQTALNLLRGGVIPT